MVNPYEPPSEIDLIPKMVVAPKGSLLLTSIVAGTLLGNLVLLAIDRLFVEPFWGQSLSRGDPRWDTICWLSSTGQTVASLCGIFFMVIVARYTSFRLQHGRAIACCVLLAVIVLTHFYPGMQYKPGANRPMFEVIPETILIIDALIAMIIALAWANSATKGEQNAQPKLPSTLN